MAGDIDFLRELEAFLAGLDWVEVTYARIAQDGAVDLGVVTDQRARLHVDLVARFGAGRVNLVAQAPAYRGDRVKIFPDPPVGRGEGSTTPREHDVNGWSVDADDQHLTLYFTTGAGTRSPWVHVDEAADAVEVRVLSEPPPDGVRHALVAYPGEVRIALSNVLAGRSVRDARGIELPRYRREGDDVFDAHSGERLYQRSAKSRLY